MPTYEYHCKKCQKTFEVARTIREHERKAKPACPGCGSRAVEQLPSLFRAATAKKS